MQTENALIFHVFVHFHGRHGGGVDVAVTVGRDAFGRRKLGIAHGGRRDIELDLPSLMLPPRMPRLQPGLLVSLPGASSDSESET